MRRTGGTGWFDADCDHEVVGDGRDGSPQEKHPRSSAACTRPTRANGSRKSIRAVVEDALSPSRIDVLPWHDEIRFEDDLHAGDPGDRRRGQTDQLAERLTDLLETAPPALAGRLAAAPRFSDLG